MSKIDLEYTSDIVQKPTHLNVEVFNDVLENALYRTDFHIIHVHFSMGSSIGDNYTSDIYRVKVTYKFLNNESLNYISLIIKCMPITEANDFLVILNAFHKEKIFYNHVLPCLEYLYLNDSVKFGSRLFKSLKQPIQTLIFEDLMPLQYAMASRTNGLNEMHALVVMKKLGQFHAASMILMKKKPELIQCFQNYFSTEETIKKGTPLHNLFYECLLALIELVENWPDYQDIIIKMRNYASNFIENIIQSVRINENDIKVLVHNDLWINNILFQYNNNGQPIDVKFIDFQMSIWSNPSLDLIYFLYSSLQLEVMQTKLKNLIYCYYQSLSDSLKILNNNDIECPTYQQIFEQIEKRAKFAFFVNYALLPSICLDKKYSNNCSFENFANNDFTKEKVKVMFNNDRVQSTLRYTLKLLNQMGAFD